MGRKGFSGAALVLLATLWPADASAQPVAPVEPVQAAPEPGADELPSETPPPPPLTVAEDPPPPLRAVVSTVPLVEIRTYEPSPRQRLDPMLPMTTSSIGLGGLLLLGGIIAFGSEPEAESYCTATGCVERDTGRLARNVGADLLGAGAGLAAVGAVGMGTWVAGARSRMRRNAPLGAAGFGMTALGAAGAGLGLAQTITHKREELDASTSWPLFFTSGLLLAGGIPMWAIGAHGYTKEERDAVSDKERKLADPRVKRHRRSIGSVVGGSIMVGLGGLGGLAGTVIMIADADINGGPTGITTIIALPSLGAGALFTGIGLPLLLSGNRKVIDGEEQADSLMPEVTIGAAGMGATWRLD